MARPGITYAEVAAAAQSLTAQGHYPTIERIRAQTGTGSSTTIAQHLRAWRAQQENTRLLCQQENLPEEFTVMLKGLWERVLEQAEERVQVIQQDFEQQRAELVTQVQILQTDTTHWQQQYQETSQLSLSLQKEKTALEQDIKQLEKDALVLTTDLGHAIKQSQAKDEQLTELQRLNQQVQTNLEHYREAAREQRIMDQQRHEQSVLQLEQTLQHLRHELSTAQNQKHIAQNQYEKLHYAHELLHNEQSKLQQEYDLAKSQLAKLTEQLAQETHTKQHWQVEHVKLQTRIDAQQQTVDDLQKQVVIAGEQLNSARREMEALVNEHKILTQEKWVLLQENARFEGEVKALQTMHHKMVSNV